MMRGTWDTRGDRAANSACTAILSRWTHRPADDARERHAVARRDPPPRRRVRLVPQDRSRLRDLHAGSLRPRAHTGSGTGLPESLDGKSVLDVGPGHGFFAFEFERRGARRVATSELPDWTAHDASPELKDFFHTVAKDGVEYHRGALGFAIQARGSRSRTQLLRRLRSAARNRWYLRRGVLRQRPPASH